MTKYVRIDGVVRYFPNGCEAEAEIASEAAPKKGKKQSKAK